MINVIIYKLYSGLRGKEMVIFSEKFRNVATDFLIYAQFDLNTLYNNCDS